MFAVYPTISDENLFKHTLPMFKPYIKDRAEKIQLDDNSVAFFLRRLEQNIGRVFESYSPELTFERDCVQQYDLDPGAEEIVYTEVDGTGEARIIGGATTDIRLSSVQAAEVKLKTARVAAGFNYTEKELDNMIMSSKNGSPFDVKEHRIKRAVQALDEFAEDLGYFGSNEHQIYGMITDPAITLVDSTFKPYLTTRTANELYSWFIGLYTTVVNNTFERFKPNVCRMTYSLFSQLISVRDSESNMTAWELLQKFFNNPQSPLTTVVMETRTALRTERLQRNGAIASNENKEVLLFYHLSPDTVIRKINNVRSKPLELDGFNYIGRLYYDVSSVVMPYKKVINFIKYSKATT